MKQRIRLTESQLNRVIKESVKKILRESIGVFDVYTNDYKKGLPVYVRVNSDFYQVPPEKMAMLRELGTRQGRRDFIDTITNGEIPTCDIDVLELRGRGYKSRAFNANAF